MCHLSMKLSDMFDQNPPCTFDKIRENPIPMKNALTALMAKVKVITKIKSQCPGEQKTCLPKKNLRRGSLSNWCDADADEDADADIKQCVDPHPTGGST